jgi:hypothetical protein
MFYIIIMKFSKQKNIIIIFIFIFFIFYIFNKTTNISLNNKYKNLNIKKIHKNRERYIVKNFLNEEDINFLIKMNNDFGRTFPHKGEKNITNKGIVYQIVHTIECNIYMLDYVHNKRYNEIQNKIKDIINYITNNDDIMDYCVTVKTGKPGISKHSDNSKLHNNKWVPNHTPTRTWSASLLLKDPKDFKGGVFQFYSPIQIVKLQKGDLVVFASDESNLHSVSKIESGERYVQLTWLQKNNLKNKLYNFLKAGYLEMNYLLT